MHDGPDRDHNVSSRHRHGQPQHVRYVLDSEQMRAWRSCRYFAEKEWFIAAVGAKPDIVSITGVEDCSQIIEMNE